MIQNRNDLVYYLDMDRIALGKNKKTRPYWGMRFGNFSECIEGTSIIVILNQNII